MFQSAAGKVVFLILLSCFGSSYCQAKKNVLQKAFEHHAHKFGPKLLKIWKDEKLKTH